MWRRGHRLAVDCRLLLLNPQGVAARLCSNTRQHGQPIPRGNGTQHHQQTNGATHSMADAPSSLAGKDSNDAARSRLFQMLSVARRVAVATPPPPPGSTGHRAAPTGSTPSTTAASPTVAIPTSPTGDGKTSDGTTQGSTGRSEAVAQHREVRFIVPAAISTPPLVASIEAIVGLLNCHHGTNSSRRFSIVVPSDGEAHHRDAVAGSEGGAGPPLPPQEGDSEDRAAELPPGTMPRYQPLHAMQQLCVQVLRVCTHQAEGNGGGGGRRLIASEQDNALAMHAAVGAFLCAAVDHPALQADLLKMVPTWEALASHKDMVATNSAAAAVEDASNHGLLHTPQEDEVLASCPTSVVLSLYAAVNALNGMWMEGAHRDASDSPSATRLEEVRRLHRRLSDQAARLVTHWVLCWDAHTAVAVVRLRTFHLLRNAARLRNGWQRRHRRLAVEERTMAAAVLCLLLRSASEPASFLHAQRTTLFCDVAVDLYALVGANPTSSTEPERQASVAQPTHGNTTESTAPSIILHRTVHTALNHRLHVASAVASVVCSREGSDCVEWHHHGSGADVERGFSCPASIPSLLAATHLDVVILPPILCAALVAIVEHHVLRGCVARWSPATSLRYQKQCVQLALSIEADLTTMGSLRDSIVATRGGGAATAVATSVFGWLVMHPVSSHAAAVDVENKTTPTDGYEAQGAADRADGTIQPPSPPTTSQNAAVALPALRRAIASTVLQIALALSPSTELSRDAPPSAVLRWSPFLPHHRKDGHDNLVPVVCTFLRHLRSTFDALVRRHYALSGGREVLEDALHAMFIGFMAGEQLRPVAPRRRDPRYVKLCPGDVPVGTAMEMLYFTALLLRRSGSNGRGGDGVACSDASQVVHWERASQRLFRFVADALVHNTRRYLSEASSSSFPSSGATTDPSWGGGTDGSVVADAHISAAFFLAQGQFHRPTLLSMPVWQLTEWLFAVYCFYGPLRTPDEDDRQGADDGAKDMLLASLAPPPPSAEATASDASTTTITDGASEDDNPSLRADVVGVGSNLGMLRTFAARRVHRLEDLARALNLIRHRHREEGSSAQQRRGTSAKRKPRQADVSTPFNTTVSVACMHQFELPVGVGSNSADYHPSAAAMVAHRTAGMRRFKQLSVLAVNVGMDFNVVEERRQRTAEKRRQRLVQGAIRNNKKATPLGDGGGPHAPSVAGIDGDDVMEDRASDEGSGQLTVLVGRRAGGGSFGFSTTAQCVVDHITRGDAFSAAVETLGWYASDVVGMRVVRVNRTNIRTVADMVQAMQASPSGQKVRFTLEADGEAAARSAAASASQGTKAVPAEGNAVADQGRRRRTVAHQVRALDQVDL